MTISINVRAQSKWKEENFSGIYDMIETVNNRPAYKVSFCNFFKIFIKVTTLTFQRNEKTESGKDIYLLSHSSKTGQEWQITDSESFKSRDGASWLKIKSEGNGLLVMEAS